MKVLDAFISFVFSIIVLVLSIAIILVLTGFTSDGFIVNLLEDYVFNDAYRNIVFISSIVLVLAALKTTIFHSRFKSKDTAPILVATEHGNVEIAQETITNTVKSVAMKLTNIKDVNAKMIKKKSGIIVFANISVLANSNIKALTEELQSNVIEVIKETTGVKVLDVNIKVKNIYEKSQKAESKKVEVSKVEESKNDAQIVEENVSISSKEEVVEDVIENEEEKKEE